MTGCGGASPLAVVGALVGIGDHDVDDLAWRNKGSGTVSVWQMTASGSVAHYLHPGSDWTNIA